MGAPVAQDPPVPPVDEPTEQQVAPPAGEALDETAPAPPDPTPGEQAADAGEQDDAADPSGADRLPAAAEGGGLPLHGQVGMRYRYRAVDGEDDHDLTSSVLLDVGDASTHAWTGHAQAWINWDVDGDSGSAGAAFTDVSDTWDHDLTARLYAAYADYHGSDAFDLLRIGRQDLWETPAYVTFDGVRAETSVVADPDVRFELYGGIPVHFFESSADGDLVAGLATSLRPWDGGRLRLDWMHLEDEALLGDHVNDLLGLSAWHRLDERLRLDGRATLLDGDGRDARVRATFVDPESELTVLGTYYVLYDEQNDLVQELDPFTATLLTLHPFHRAQLSASMPLREDLYVEGGYERRELLDSDDESDFNHDFGRLHAAATALDLAEREVDLRLSGELWDASGARTSAWGVDLSRAFEDVEASVGSFYALYKYDFLLAEEREDVRTYYADLEWHRTAATTFDVRYEFENGPLDDYHVLRVGMRWRF